MEERFCPAHLQVAHAGKFQDGMAIVREYHQPDFFITMTCNPNWPEIQGLLRKGQTAQDRPDIVARVFKQKKDQLMQDLKSGHILGNVVAHMQVIEFQKRGLPHAHILIILAEDDRVLTPDMVDSVVVAELPPDPENETDPLRKKGTPAPPGYCTEIRQSNGYYCD